MGVKFPGKKRCVTLEWPLRVHVILCYPQNYPGGKLFMWHLKNKRVTEGDLNDHIAVTNIIKPR